METLSALHTVVVADHSVIRLQGRHMRLIGKLSTNNDCDSCVQEIITVYMVYSPIICRQDIAWPFEAASLCMIYA